MEPVELCGPRRRPGEPDRFPSNLAIKDRPSDDALLARNMKMGILVAIGGTMPTLRSRKRPLRRPAGPLLRQMVVILGVSLGLRAYWLVVTIAG